MTTQRPLTVGDLIDYLQQFPMDMPVYETVAEVPDSVVGAVVLEHIDFYVED
jgi:hypothetical protein